MARPSQAWSHIVWLPVLLLVACQATGQAPSIHKSAPEQAKIPSLVQRLVVVCPSHAGHDLKGIYLRLEGGSFQLKAQRPSLRIIDRGNLAVIFAEQQLQMGGDVSDDSAVRIGRLLGADSVLFYHVDVPSLRDLVWARFHGEVPPVTVTSKIILVESAEVVFHNVVTASIKAPDGDASAFTWQPLLRAALDRGVEQTISDLQQAFY